MKVKSKDIRICKVNTYILFQINLYFLWQDLIDSFIEKKVKRPTDFKTIDAACLKWTPHAKRQQQPQTAP